MSPGIDLYYKNFRVALIICIALAAFVLSTSYLLGKKELFLLLNNDYGGAADFFFQYFTYMGDGLLWIVWLITILFKKRKQLLPLIISSFILTTIFTQIFKYFILPNEARPSTAFNDISIIHFVQGVEVHSINSFPSGHTATAFTFVLLIALTVKRKDMLCVAFLVALLVAYSRIYLGQHFPVDIGGGIVAAVCSVCLSLIVQRWFDNRIEA